VQRWEWQIPSLAESTVAEMAAARDAIEKKAAEFIRNFRSPDL